MKRFSTSYQPIYALYDKSDENVFNGTAKECVEYIGCTMNAFTSALCRKVHAGRKYRIHKMDEEVITEKKCKICGKVKKVEEFKYKHYNGSYHLTNKCLKCFNEIANDYQREKYESNKKKHSRD